YSPTFQYSSMSAVLTAAKARPRDASIISMTSAKACSSGAAETALVAGGRLARGVDDFMVSPPRRASRRSLTTWLPSRHHSSGVALPQLLYPLSQILGSLGPSNGGRSAARPRRFPQGHGLCALHLWTA